MFVLFVLWFCISSRLHPLLLVFFPKRKSGWIKKDERGVRFFFGVEKKGFFGGEPEDVATILQHQLKENKKKRNV